MISLKNALRTTILFTQLISMPQAYGYGANYFPEDNLTDITDDILRGSHPYKVIYGKDHREEAREYPDALFREKAKSVAGMVSKRNLAQDFFDPNLINFFKKTASREFGLCEDERFSTQITLPVCTGFLVDEQHLVTAGHCFQREEDCENFVWVFDYVKGTKKLEADKVYGCQEIVQRELKSTYFSVKDYMVIKLDRPVTDREPLEYRKEGRPNYGEELVIIGHPLGLPQKIAGGAEVKLGNIRGAVKPISSLIKKRDYFMANLDAFVGNSGSPVFNEKTGLVEGILIEGAEDLFDDFDNLCTRAVKKRDSTHVTDEKIFRINRIPFLVPETK